MSNREAMTVFTIGHSNHSIEQFIALLKRSGVTAIADVRSSPFSRFNPQFNKDVLSKSLSQAGIAYVFVGKELGARSEDQSCYENGRVLYDRLAQTDLFKTGIERVLNGAQRYQIALMCAEKEPLDCHRTLLVSRALEARHVLVFHILPNGVIEPMMETMTRLLDLVGLPKEDMFRSREELIHEACKIREARIAYIDLSQTDQVQN